MPTRKIYTIDQLIEGGFDPVGKRAYVIGKGKILHSVYRIDGVDRVAVLQDSVKANYEEYGFDVVRVEKIDYERSRYKKPQRKEPWTIARNNHLLYDWFFREQFFEERELRDATQLRQKIARGYTEQGSRELTAFDLFDLEKVREGFPWIGKDHLILYHNFRKDPRRGKDSYQSAFRGDIAYLSRVLGREEKSIDYQMDIWFNEIGTLRGMGMLEDPRLDPLAGYCEGAKIDDFGMDYDDLLNALPLEREAAA